MKKILTFVAPVIIAGAAAAIFGKKMRDRAATGHGHIDGRAPGTGH